MWSRAKKPPQSFIQKLHVLKRLQLTFMDWWKIVHFGPMAQRQFVRRPQNTEFKPQYTVKPVRRGGASIMMFLKWWCWAYLSHARDHGSVWILQNTRTGHAALTLKRKCPWNGCFNSTTTLKTPVNEQHLGSRPTRLTLWSEIKAIKRILSFTHLFKHTIILNTTVYVIYYYLVNTQTYSFCAPASIMILKCVFYYLAFFHLPFTCIQ